MNKLKVLWAKYRALPRIAQDGSLALLGILLGMFVAWLF